MAIKDLLNQVCKCKFLMFANWGDRKKEEMKGWKNTGCLSLEYTVHHLIAQVYINFQLTTLNVYAK